MKNLLLIFVLLLFSIQSFAGSCPDGSEPVKSISADGTYFVFNCGAQESSASLLETQNSKKICEKVNLPKDIASGAKFGVCLADKTAFKSHGAQIVDKKDGHPVRAGNKSLRFELRDGDCNDPPPPAHNDCKTDRERFELSAEDIYSGEEWWYAWSIFIPKDFINISPAYLSLGQFHLEPTPEGDPCCNLSLRNRRGGYHLQNPINNFDEQQLLTHSEMVETWNDILINLKLSKKDNGFIKLWLNDKLVYEYQGPTLTKNSKFVSFKFGIYRSFISWFLNQSKRLYNISKLPTQVIYYDEVRVGKSKEQVVGNLPQKELEKEQEAKKAREQEQLETKKAREQEQLLAEIPIYDMNDEALILNLDQAEFFEISPPNQKNKNIGWETHKAEIYGELRLENFQIPKFRPLAFKFDVLNESRLSINVGELNAPEFRPFTRHQASLQKECGLGLMNEYDWMSFVSETTNMKSAKNQQCHYDYFKDANDEEAWKLFQAVLGGTDSTLNYLEESVER
ncbi:polysaccharide lyase [Candidatus Pseudothioglobus singularis]|nr:polysaccharide lyase [Candidatus Pseudothioglobus singularis]MDB4822973.1 polysaccharide lyase [Candidatus Pseudothioglobus singularis]